MLDTLKTYLLYGNRFCGVEYTLKDEQDMLYVTVLKRAKKTLNIDTISRVTSIEGLASKLSKNQHIFLVINNDNVLTKCVEDQTNSNKNNRVYNAFPNLNIDDFYYEIIDQNGKHFVSICRKSYLEALLTKFKGYGVQIINVSLGNNVIAGITGFTTNRQISSSNSNIFIEDGLIKSIEKRASMDTAEYDINGLQTSNTDLLSLSGALETVIGTYNSQTNFEHLILSLKDTFFQSRFYNLFLKTGLVLILSILLVNFFVFNHYFDQVNDLQQTSQINEVSKQDLLQLNEAVSKSQKMVDDMLKSNASKSSFYVNAIIQSLPESVLLSELNYQPLLKRIKKDKPVETNTNIILISGVSNNSESFSKWINSLESLTWVHGVDILGYEDASVSESTFNLKLNLIIEI
ncbi:hypothetical protein [Seonamhaeicola sp.]|uniref:hypothetical protein n=1 Tax=Seonamhaeicola sp. TaxID=1912245 RepID=UPI00262E3E43|nr:hypothetical protein [Seonamhaeicola sp.]